jgi:uncharacterized protein YrrD
LRLTNLLGAEVVDRAGRSAGRVHDVRLVQDGPILGGFGAGLRLDGLIVGRRAVGTRLGYERGRMHGPLLVKLVAGWLRHDGRLVAWDRVEAITEDRIHISGSADDLPRPAEAR